MMLRERDDVEREMMLREREMMLRERDDVEREKDDVERDDVERERVGERVMEERESDGERC